MKSLSQYISEAFNFRINRDSEKNVYSYFPKTKDELIEIIADHYKNNTYDLNDIDVSQIEDFSDLFFDDENTGNPKFDISRWDVSNSENFEWMFYSCSNFNCDLSNWNVSKGINFKKMFYKCKNFNSDLSQWNVNNGEYFLDMFYKCPIKQEFKPKHKDIE